MLTSNDIKRIKEDPKVRRLNNLATACANANSDDFKDLWYSKLMKLGKTKFVYCMEYKQGIELVKAAKIFVK